MLTKLRTITAWTLVAAALTLLSVQSVHAGANEYTLTQNINVALLRLKSAGQSGAAPTTGSLEAPYIFDILNNRPDIKPPVWHLQNPMATRTVDTEVNSREQLETGITTPYSDNQQILPSMAPYWELDFNKVSSATQLTQYNLLMIRADTTISFTLAQRQILRQYVDQGGTLWIDVDTSPVSGDAASANTPLSYSNIFRVIFGAAASGTQASTYRHPIVQSPNVFTGSAVDSLGYGGIYSSAGNGARCLKLTSSVSVGASYNSPPDPTMFYQISDSLIAGDYGSGHVVIDGLGIGDWINLDGGSQQEYEGTWSAGTMYNPGQVVLYGTKLYHCLAGNSGNEPDLDVYNPTLTPYHHVNWSSNTDPYDSTAYSSASSQDLRFLVNVLTYATESTTEGGNLRGNNQQGGSLAGAVSTNWQYFDGSSMAYTPSGMATYGKFFYTTDNLGYLSCFDINPSESIFSDANNGDDGTTDLSAGASYDLIWKVNPTGRATPLSAPVIAQVPGSAGKNVPIVMVEDLGGNIYGYQADYDPGPGNINNNLPLPQLMVTGSGSTFSMTPPPAPTYYRGELIAPEPSATGEVAVWNLLAEPSTSIPYPTSNSTTAFTFPVDYGSWLQPIGVASIPSNDLIYNGSVIVAYAVNNYEVQTMMLGSRDEQMNSTGAATSISSTYSTFAAALTATTSSELFGAQEDTLNSVLGSNWILDYNGDFSTFGVTASTPAQPNSVQTDAPTETLYSDYDLYPTTGSAPIRTNALAQLSDNNGINSGGSPNIIAGASVGPDNILYLTVNEPGATTGSAFIEAVNEQNPSKASIAWRFELSNYTPIANDPDGISYTFSGDQFKGAPVVGNDGLVYAIANNSTKGCVDIFAFNANPAAGYMVPTTFNGGQGYTITQTDEFGTTETIMNDQYNGTDQFTNFSPNQTGSIAPSLYAPGTIKLTPVTTAYGNNNGATTGTATTVAVDTAFNGATPMLEWYTEIPNLAVGTGTGSVSATSAPRRIGDYIYFGANSSTGGAETVAVYAEPSQIGLQPNANNRLIASSTSANATSDYRFVQLFPSQLNQVTLPPVASGKYMATAGSGPATGGGGYEGLSYNTVLVADGNRLVEFDPSGNATWTLDSTQQNTSFGSAVTTGGTIESTNGATSVALNRPSTVTQLNANDYLIADTGNNRCVHTDRFGNVLTQITDPKGNILIPEVANGLTYGLEINHFADPLGLLPVGQQLTLSRPNSVVTWETYDYGTSATNTLQAINVHYLIADTGNNRVLDIVDRYKNGGSGNLFELSTSADFHYLDWISKTSDIGSRLYAYNGAEPILYNSGTPQAYTVQYPDNVGMTSSVYLNNQATAILGNVGDKYIPNLDTTQASNLTQINKDTAGSTILEFYYASGLAYSSTNKYGCPFNLINAVEYIPDVSGATNVPTLLPLRGLRSAVAVNYTLPTTLGQFVIADADGVFSGTATGSGASTNINVPNALDATYGSKSLGWSFLANDYTNYAVAPYDSTLNTTQPLVSGSHVDYQSTSFYPSSVIELPGNNFLIVNRGAIGNQNAPATGVSDNGFGGNVFTIHANISGTSAPVDTLDGPIIGKPSDTGPLSAPAFALQSN